MKRYVVKPAGELAEHRSGTLITWHDHVTAITAVEDERDRLREALIEQAKATAHEALANARLIAAAPELLRVLEYLAGEPKPLLPHGSYELRIARAAIAKARGEG